MTVNFAIHTPTPILPLVTMVADSALVVAETNHAGKFCCFYGWGEPMVETRSTVLGEAHACKPHHVVSSEDSDTIHHLAASLVALGYEAVVTTGEPDGDHEEIPGAPFLYNQTHQH